MSASRRLLAAAGLLGAAACAEGPAPLSDGPVFEEQARKLGLVFDHANGMSGEFYIVEVLGPGGALLDYDNDGDLDVYLVQGTRLGPGLTPGLGAPADDAGSEPGDRLFRNDLVVAPDGRATLRFTDVTAQARPGPPGYGMGAVAGDYDNDGWIDLYVTRFGSNVLLHNEGDGSFADATASSGTDDVRWSVAAAFFDYDRDGWLDLFVGNYVDFRFSNHKQCLPEQGFVDYCSPLAYDPEPDRLFRNRGDGTFEDVTAQAGLRSAFGNALGAFPADLDGDGLEDLYVANDWSENQLWINRGDGTFVDRALALGCAVNADGRPEASMGVVAHDFDEDGDDDLFMSHLMGEKNTLYRNAGAGSFDDDSIPSGLGGPSWDYTGFGVAALDYDNDGWVDLYVANGAVRLIMSLLQRGDPFPLSQPDQLFRNLGTGAFHDVSSLLEPRSEVGRGVAAGDVDNDGDTDLVVFNNQGPARLLRNRVGSARSWIGLRLVDRSGRDALGARVRLTWPDGTTRTRRAQTAGSYASSNDPRVLIGLDSAGTPGKVRVRWPDGTVEAWDGLPAGRYSALRQGSGRAMEAGAF